MERRRKEKERKKGKKRNKKQVSRDLNNGCCWNRRAEILIVYPCKGTLWPELMAICRPA